MARKKTTSAGRSPKKVEAVRHKDKRKNIPTEELRDFVRDDENRPQTVLYPRDPDLDPQLVWKGKDEQDAEPLEVPAVPVYIQEKIHPQAIIEDFKREHAREQPTDHQLNLFGDFNGLPEEFDKRVDFYHHEGNWSNRVILGDSLLVMTSLAEKEALKGKVQMVYIDPPYGIKFGSNWQVSTRKSKIADISQDVTRQPEQIKAFRDTWRLGIHSYLAYLRDRLVVARDLLTETGSIFVQIGDENVHLVRCLLDEVCGRENFITIITVKKTAGLSKGLMPEITDFVLWYAKSKRSAKRRVLHTLKDFENDTAYGLFATDKGEHRPVKECDLPRRELEQRILRYQILLAAGRTPSCVYPIEAFGSTFQPTAGRSWSTNPKGMSRLMKAGRVVRTGRTLNYVRFGRDNPVNPLSNFWGDTASGSGMDKVYVVQTNTKVIERCIQMATDPGDLVLDPTCGSGTTAYVAEQWARRWITIDSSRVSLTLARTRLMAGRFPYYMLADSHEGIRKEAEILSTVPPTSMPETDGDVRRGFVCERVPHVMLKDIANNDKIDTIHTVWQERLEPIRVELNGLLSQQWEEWEVPARAEPNWPNKAQALFGKWRDYRTARQTEIDESIARHSDQHILHDRPYEDKKTIRVAGPFTVESLSPHRTISVDEKTQMATTDQGHGFSLEVRGPDDFGRMILDNLRTAGVQNTFKGERLKFDTLQPYAGQWIHGEGEYAESDGTVMRTAICIGPEHGTVGPELVKEAAKEAVQGVGFDVLIVCGFAFDPHVSEEAKRYGKLVVLPTKMNPDLAMGELLKKTGSGNLFMVFGEPDVDIDRDSDDKITVEIKGLDVYDPTTGEIRSSGTDDIACWFIDTNYDGESFFVRHAYFTGAGEPYDKLKRALRAEIDEAAWADLYLTKSRPFDKPETGKIAVKVINHYGDEVLKVYEA